MLMGTLYSYGLRYCTSARTSDISSKITQPARIEKNRETSTKQIIKYHRTSENRLRPDAINTGLESKSNLCLCALKHNKRKVKIYGIEGQCRELPIKVLIIDNYQSNFFYWTVRLKIIESSLSDRLYGVFLIFNKLSGPTQISDQKRLLNLIFGPS